MSNTFLAADLHLGHHAICNFTRHDGSKLRPYETVEEMHDTFMTNWNAVVNPADRVYILGDVVMKRAYLPLLSKFNGRKVLVKGNHDIWKLNDYRPYFDDIRAIHKLGRFYLTHVPIHPDSIPEWCVGCVHGHLHYRKVMKNDKTGAKVEDERYLNVSMECINYTPIDFNEINAIFDKRLAQNLTDVPDAK